MDSEYFYFGEDALTAGLILICVFVARNATAIADNFSHLWAIRGRRQSSREWDFCEDSCRRDGGKRLYGLLLAWQSRRLGSAVFGGCLEQHRFYRAESEESEARRGALDGVRGRYRDLAVLSGEFGLPVRAAAGADPERADDRVATAALSAVFGARVRGYGDAIIISTFGCNNGLILAGRASLRDGKRRIIFRATGKLNKHGVPGVRWCTRNLDCGFDFAAHAKADWNVRKSVQQSADDVVFAALLFYALTIAGIIVLRVRRPDAERRTRHWDPMVPGVVYSGSERNHGVLLLY